MAEPRSHIPGPPIKGIDDREHTISFYPLGNCLWCAHYKGPYFQPGTTGKCKAFDNIPLKIWHGEISHEKPYPNDNGYRFKLKRNLKEKYEKHPDIQRLKKKWERE